MDEIDRIMDLSEADIDAELRQLGFVPEIELLRMKAILAKALAKAGVAMD